VFIFYLFLDVNFRHLALEKTRVLNVIRYEEFDLCTNVIEFIFVILLLV